MRKVTRPLAQLLRGRRRRVLAFASAVVIAVVATVGIAVAQQDPETPVYDPALGRTVPAGVAPALREVEPSSEPESPGEVSPDDRLDPSVPEADPPSGVASVKQIDVRSDDYAGLPFASGILRPTSVYSRGEGDVVVTIYAGASAENPQAGMLVKLLSNIVTGDDVFSAHTIPDAGAITLTGHVDGRVLFTSASGRFGTLAPDTLAVEYDRPPDCAAVAAAPSSLWPPDHTMRIVRLSGATDPDGDDVTLTVTTVTQDEPLDGLGDGDARPDAARGTVSNEVLLRAERQGPHDGRVYRVSFEGADGKGGTCAGRVIVEARDSQSKPSIDSNLVFDSFGA